MPYYIFKNTIDHPEKIEIKESEYLSAKAGREAIVERHKIETSFHCVCAAYHEALLYTFDQALTNSLYFRHDQSDLILISIEFGRKLSYFLSSSRLYIETTPRQVPNIDHRIHIEEVKRIFSARYDASADYRIMESLRNFSQHAALPVHKSNHSASWDDDRESLSYYVEFFFEYDSIKNNKKLSKRSMKEIEDSSPINLVRCLKYYFSDLCNIHREIRSMIEPTTGCARSLIEEMQARWKNQFEDERLVGVAIAQFFDAHKYDKNSMFYIDDTIFKALEALQKKVIASKNAHRVKIANDVESRP